MKERTLFLTWRSLFIILLLFLSVIAEILHTRLFLAFRQMVRIALSHLPMSQEVLIVKLVKAAQLAVKLSNRNLCRDVTSLETSGKFRDSSEFRQKPTCPTNVHLAAGHYARVQAEAPV